MIRRTYNSHATEPTISCAGCHRHSRALSHTHEQAFHLYLRTRQLTLEATNDRARALCNGVHSSRIGDLHSMPTRHLPNISRS
jgi:hypothetical protein